MTNVKEGGVLQIWSKRVPQGYVWRAQGNLSKELVDLEGISLVRVPVKESKEAQIE